LCIGKFDIWAKRGIQVVWSEVALRSYDEWLFRHAQGWLEDLGKAGYDADVLIELRLRLMERVEWWKGEARRYVCEVKTQSASLGKMWTELQRRGELIVVSQRPKDHSENAIKKDYRLLFQNLRELNQWLSQKRDAGIVPALEEVKEVFRGTILVGNLNRVPYLTDGELRDLTVHPQSPSLSAVTILAKRWGFTEATTKTYLRRKPRPKRLRD
jgi:hypothetical protein